MAVRAEPGIEHVSGAPTSSSPPAAAGGNRSALVLFSSRYGNTKRVAHALARGLGAVAGVSVDVVAVESCPPSSLAGYDLIAVGAPTEWRSATGAVKRFLADLDPEALRGKRSFSFDTRYRSALSGSAAKAIAARLDGLGLVPLRPPASAFVSPTPEPEHENLLSAEAEPTFEAIGRELAAALIATP